MPTRFFDYEFDLLHSSLKHSNKRRTGHRKSTDTATSSRHNSTSAPTSATTTRSSDSSSASASSSMTWHPHQNPHRNGVQQPQGSHNMRNPYREDQVEPTPQIQAWAHQMHIQQRTQYWWCSSCYPKTEALEIPKEKAVRRVRIQEPTHAYE